MGARMLMWKPIDPNFRSGSCPPRQAFYRSAVRLCAFRQGGPARTRLASQWRKEGQRKRTGRPNFACTISPCSVTRSVPATLPGGWLLIATCMGPPPRPMEPPRPWKRVSLTLNSLQTATSCSWQM